MMWASIISAVLFVSVSSCSPAQQSAINASDTIVLYKKDTVVSTGIMPTVIPVSFGINSQTLYSADKRTFIIFENASLINPPDGVYELYLSSQQSIINNNTPGSLPGFVSTLDLYSFTAPNAAKEIKVDITEQVKNIFEKKSITTNTYFIIRFEANRLAGGTPSTNAGKLHFSSIRIIQTGNKEN